MRRRSLLAPPPEDSSVVINGYEFIDMGLSVKWATCNIGATKPEDKGWYFQWGDTKAYNSDRTPVGGGSAISFDWSNYPLCNGSMTMMTKYCTDLSYGAVDNKITLEPVDDAAKVHMGKKWRMPSSAEYQELINACDITHVSNYNNSGVSGHLFTLKSNRSKTLFFPGAGYLLDTSLYYENSTLYWSSSLDNSEPYKGGSLDGSSSSIMVGSFARGNGLVIRGVMPPEAEDLFNVVIYDTAKNELFQTKYPENFAYYKYKPVGIIVIPSSHDVYGTGECGVLALKYASVNTPSTGQTTNTEIVWGQYGVDITELFNYTDMVYSKINGNDTGTAQGVDGTISMPSDINSASQCSTDPVAYYIDNRNSAYAPSPYLKDLARNPAYYQTTSPSTKTNALSDFAGKANTEILISKHTAQSNWKTSTYIQNYPDPGYSPAACACWMYTTDGTYQGNWYLPAAGELGYVYARLKAINVTLSKVNNLFIYDDCCELVINGAYASSSEAAASHLFGLVFSNGIFTLNHVKNSAFTIRPFMRGKFEIREKP